MSMNRKLLSGVLGGLTSTAVSMAVSFAQFSILLRHLPLDVVGIWMIFANLGSYAMFLDLGLTPTLGREVSFASGNPSLSASSRTERIGTLTRSCTVVVGVLSILVLLLGGPLGWAYLHSIVPLSLVAHARPAWSIFIFAVALNLVGQGWYASIYGLGFVFHEKMIRSATSLLGLLFFAIAVFSHTGFEGLSVAYLLQSVCAVLLAMIVLTRVSDHALSKGRLDLKSVRGMIAPSLKYAATLLGGILILQTDNIVIASVLGPDIVPNYQVVAKLITALMTLSMMLVMTSMPFASQAFARNDMPAMMQILNRNLRFTLSVTVILGSFLACFSDRVIAVWLGPNHFVGFPIVWVLLTVMILEAHSQAMAAATMCTGRLAFVASALIAGVINIGVSIVLAQHFGLLGVVLGTMVAQVVTNNWYAPWYTMRLFKISFLEHSRTVILPVLSLIVAMLATVAAVRFLTSPLSNILSLTIGVFFTLAMGATCFSFLIVSRKERNTLLSKLRDIGVRLMILPSQDVPL